MAVATDFPISHAVVVESIPAKGRTVVIAPGAAERSAIARALRIIAVDALSADFRLQREGHRVRIKGTLSAEVTQACVISLEPVAESISEDIEVVYAPKEEADAAMRAAGLPPDGDDEAMLEMAGIDLAMLNDPDALPDPIEGGRIDLGVLTYESLAVALDPYPRKPGAVFEAPAEPEGFGSPFAVLKSLKGKG
ncbi:MAG: DUF177 domain-containing protein [Hyphomicrobiales bacterium]|nr:DUF177 domain-containing protein [Hyphomicrobiales bacterium]